MSTKENAAGKLLEILQWVFGPFMTKKQADADAYANQRLLETIRNNPDMDITITGKGIQAQLSSDIVLERAEQRRRENERREQRNLEIIARLTAEELQDEEESISEEKVDEDWLARFFSIAKDINSDELQMIWAHILAGEIKAPGTISLRTLECVRNISKAEAETFQKILPYVIYVKGGSLFVIRDESLNNKYGIHYGELFCLGECGLLNVSSTLNYKITVCDDDATIAFTESDLCLAKMEKGEISKIVIDIYPLTKVGCELFRLLPKESNRDYFVDVINSIKKRYRNNALAYSIHNIHKFNGVENIEYNTQPRTIVKDTQ